MNNFINDQKYLAHDNSQVNIKEPFSYSHRRTSPNMSCHRHTRSSTNRVHHIGWDQEGPYWYIDNFLLGILYLDSVCTRDNHPRPFLRNESYAYTCPMVPCTLQKMIKDHYRASCIEFKVTCLKI